MQLKYRTTCGGGVCGWIDVGAGCWVFGEGGMVYIVICRMGGEEALLCIGGFWALGNLGSVVQKRRLL